MTGPPAGIRLSVKGGGVDSNNRPPNAVTQDHANFVHQQFLNIINESNTFDKNKSTTYFT